MIRLSIIVSSLVVCLNSCSHKTIDDSIDLGNKYRYIQDSPQSIIYHKTETYEGTGVEIVPPKILSYKFNDQYIIAKSLALDETTGEKKEGEHIYYWIIDKKTSNNLVKPMDSIMFSKQLDALKIDMKI